MQDLIDRLHEFANHDFPVPEVSTSLESYQFTEMAREMYTFFEDTFYTRNLVFRDKHFEILVLCWSPGQVAPVHGHEGEKCWARVESGKLQFCNYSIESESPLVVKMDEQLVGEAGHLDGPAEIHSVENIFDEPAMCLHIYAKPFDACDIYDIEKKTVDRVTLNYHSKFGELC
jgi:cysteine dioxygenase